MGANSIPLEQVQRETLELAQGFFGVGSLVLVSGIVLACLLGFFVLAIAMAPDLTRRMGQAVSNRWILSFFAGVPIAAVIVVALHVGHAVPVVGVAAVVSGFYLGGLGLSASAEGLGRKVFWAAGKMGNRPLHAVVGGVVLAAVGVIPVAGWLIAAYALVSGLGSVVVGLCDGKAQAPAPPLSYRMPT